MKCKRLLKSNRRERFAYAEKLTDRKNESERALPRDAADLALLLAGCAAAREPGPEAPLTNVDYAGAIDALAARLTLPEARKLVSDAEGAIDKLERNVNARLLAEVTVAGLAEACMKQAMP